VKEYPSAEGEPYYPNPNVANEALYQRCKALTRRERRVFFTRRLAQYRYYTVDQVVAAAWSAARHICGVADEFTAEPA